MLRCLEDQAESNGMFSKVINADLEIQGPMSAQWKIREREREVTCQYGICPLVVLETNPRELQELKELMAYNSMECSVIHQCWLVMSDWIEIMTKSDQLVYSNSCHVNPVKGLVMKCNDLTPGMLFNQSYPGTKLRNWEIFLEIMKYWLMETFNFMAKSRVALQACSRGVTLDSNS